MLCLETAGYRYSQKRCEDIVLWFIANYLPRHKLDIIVNHRGLVREGVIGWCTVLDLDSRPRDFEIEIHNRLNVETYTKTLLHELWHVYQHVKGDLKDKGFKRFWKGIDHSETDYSDQPWEIEASKKEQELYNKYMKIEYFPNRLTC